jgi:hypothetical protein
VVLEYVQVVLEYVQCHVRVQFHCDHYYNFSAVNRTAVRKERSLKKIKNKYSDTELSEHRRSGDESNEIKERRKKRYVVKRCDVAKYCKIHKIRK